jgi:hypothetical protein
MGPITIDIGTLMNILRTNLYIANRYDCSLNSTVLTLVEPVVLQLVMGWREAAWLNGILLLSSPLTRPLIITTMDTEAVVQAVPYKTYNLEGLGQSTVPARTAYCIAHRAALGIA